MARDFSKLEQHLGLSFKNADLLKQALVHRSYLNEHPDFGLEHNERLEFLGDAVLELAVTEYLYAHFPNPEGDLTNWRAALVNADMMAVIAQRLHLEDYLYLSKGEAKDANSKARRYILANAIEAVIGAAYLDQGYEAARDLIHRSVLTELPRILEEGSYQDPKSKFQELAQEKYGVTPTYKVISESGLDHAKQFTVGLYLRHDLIASGTGSSKHEAQVAAATIALRNEINGVKKK